MSVCAKFQLSSWSRSGWKVCGSGGVVGWGGVHVTTVSSSNASCFRVELSWVALGFDNTIFRRYYWLHNFIINFQSRSKLSTLYVFFIVRICKVGPSPGVAAAVPVWGSWGPSHTLFQGCVLGCPIRASSWSSGGRLRQLVSFLSVNLELKQNLCI